MLFKLILSILFNLTFSSYAEQPGDCNWENESSVSCITIIKSVNNTSKFNSQSVKKNIITREQIEEAGSIDLIDVLQSIPSINITQSGPKGQQASMFIRGTGSNHVLVLINGVAINDQSTTQGLHDFGVDFNWTQLLKLSGEIWNVPKQVLLSVFAKIFALLILSENVIDKLSVNGKELRWRTV